jgi:hypothetical protein
MTKPPPKRSNMTGPPPILIFRVKDFNTIVKAIKDFNTISTTPHLFQRLELATNAHPSELWTPWARSRLQEHRLLARTNTVVMRSEVEALVRQVNDNVYTVNIELGTCSCTIFQENGIPCGHGISTIFAQPGRDLHPYMPEILTIST